MKLIKKRGDISLSFGFIFSVILIAIIAATAFYAIRYFINLSKCTQISLFHKEFQDEVDAVWNSEIASDNFAGNLPGAIKSVCFKDGNFQGSGREYEELKDYFSAGGNMFLYPPENSCQQASRKAQHVDLSGLNWHCFQVKDGKVAIKLEKNSDDALVRVKRS